MKRLTPAAEPDVRMILQQRPVDAAGGGSPPLPRSIDRSLAQQTSRGATAPRKKCLQLPWLTRRRSTIDRYRLLAELTQLLRKTTKVSDGLSSTMLRLEPSSEMTVAVVPPSIEVARVPRLMD